MLKNMKSVTLKASFIFLVLMIFSIIPSRSVEAKTKEISKVANKNIVQVAKYLNYKKSKSSNEYALVYAKNKNDSELQLSTKNILACDPKDKAKKGKWRIIVTDNTISIYGIKFGMSREQTNKILTKKGWKRDKDMFQSNIYYTYSKKGVEQKIIIAYKESLPSKKEYISLYNIE